MPNQSQSSQILLYTSQDGQAKLEVKLEQESVWLTQDQMAELFAKGCSTITEHISHIFAEGELEESSVCRFFRRTGQDGQSY